MMNRLQQFPTDIYSDEKLVAMASTTFKKSYKKVPENISKHMLRFYSKK